MNLTPLDDRVLVRLPRTAEKSSGGIIIPDSTRKKADMDEQLMEVVKIGEAAFLGLYVKPKGGDEVYVSRYAGTEWRNITDDNYEYRIISDRDVTAIKADIDIQATIKELKMTVNKSNAEVTLTTLISCSGLKQFKAKRAKWLQEGWTPTKNPLVHVSGEHPTEYSETLEKIEEM